LRGGPRSAPRSPGRFDVVGQLVGCDATGRGQSIPQPLLETLAHRVAHDLERHVAREPSRRFEDHARAA
jgi:hypothetical protein